MPRKKASVRITWDVSEELNDLIGRLAEDLNTTKIDAVRRAICLLDAAVEGSKEGLSVGLASKENLRRELRVM
jgi:hypothetical protein